MWTRYLALCFALVICPSLARATSDTSFNENGSGHVFACGSFGCGDLDALLFRSGPDPFDPANGLLPLIYSYPPGYADPVAGDLLIHDGKGMLTDVVRFLGKDIVFYSLLGGGELADVGLPTTFMSRFVDLTANGPDLLYTPQDGEVGSGAGLAHEGNLFSTFSITVSSITVSAVPEPASVLLMAVGGLAVLAASRRRRFNPLDGDVVFGENGVRRAGACTG